ncbi:MAG: ABC transporter permease subunit [Ruminococcaceae bacterium]|nr:ABC transporter permease subunit [Oscillospiraceae bacterium]
MKNKLKKLLLSLAVLLFWLAVWEMLAVIIDLEFVLPRVETTLITLFELLCTKDFYLLVLSSLVRIFSSFIIGVLIAVVLALFAIRFSVFKALVSPLITISKSTPVAVLIILLWLMLSSGARVPGAVAILMVVPIIWQNMLDGYDAIDNQLEEVTKIYGFSYLKRLKILVLPTLLKFLFPGIITASGLAWKAGIAAEVICITTNSIGKEIYNAKSILDGPKTFAFTIVVLILSIAVERLIKLLIKGVSKKCRL